MCYFRIEQISNSVEQCAGSFRVSTLADYELKKVSAHQIAWQRLRTFFSGLKLALIRRIT